MKHDADRAKVILGGAMRVCCPQYNEYYDDDGDWIGEWCECICHTEDIEEGDDDD